MRTPKSFQTCIVLLIAFSMVFAYMPASAVIAASDSIKLQSDRTLSHGATHEVYSKEIDGQSVHFDVVRVDLTHDYIRVAPMYGDEISSRERVTSMTNKEDAVAGINASFFNMQNEGGTFGAVVRDGELISSPADVDGWNTFAILQNREAIIRELGFTGEIVAPTGNTFPLTGLNKTEYWSPDSPASNYSGTVHMFTSEWGSESRGAIEGYDELVEVEVTQGVVSDIRLNTSRTIPEDGYVLMGHGQGSTFLQENLDIGDTVDLQYNLTPENLDINQAVGANFLLVENGQVVPAMPEDSALQGKNSRSALGVTQDGQTLFMVSVDRSDVNPGVTLEQLASFLVDLGSHRAVNLDGGGSTSLAIKQPGHLQSTRVNTTSWERSVADALGIFNTAPKSTAKELQVSGPEVALLNESTTFQFNGYDLNYHPFSPEEVNWTVKDGTGQVNGKSVQWQEPGETFIQVEKDGVTASHSLLVIGPEQIADINVAPEDILMFPGQQQDLDVQIVLNNGKTYTFAANQLEWNTNGLGTMDGYSFTGDSSPGEGTIDISIVGKTKQIPVIIGYTFRDIQNHWAKESIEYLTEKGYASGLTASEFGPNRDLTRAELIVFLSRVMEWNIAETEQIVELDEDVPPYAEAAIKYAVHHDIIQGDHNGNIHAYNPISRMEMATILERILSSQETPPEEKQQTPIEQVYSDWDEVPEWAQEPVQYVTDRQIFGGADGQFKPRHNITRAEVVTVLVRAFFGDDSKEETMSGENDETTQEENDETTQ
ncbi:phosphodiester glycosidase family protein [Caldalkalibacillus salinus]|uniref:phosphodiester glycosidase family protein n=1 Tax=Caldalkalibacillus salinus TaxID=2803787 RepID=UPI00192227E3|nr:phosphodiester glycosidase family protein [Caldalkalibacillus salinus]